MNYLRAILDMIYDPNDMFGNWRNIVLYAVLTIVIAVIVTLVIVFTRRQK